jgi:UDP-GalNAc:undecaprenyl-phosphate GalNAc-1-phosphate transferase
MRDSLYPLHGYRHGVRPGLAGWARAYMGRRVGAPEAREELAYDLFYVRHFSFWLDCIVVFKTISLFVKRRLASPRA